jgi:hypothetical protein
MEQSWPIAEAKNDGMALRNFEKVLADNEYKADFVLYRVGWFDHDADEGAFLPEAVPVNFTMSTETGEDE